jgi:DNA mismatch endonuclease (patch repair protein)
MDVHTREQRSRNMSAVRGKNTKPELLVRSLVHRMGYRFRLHLSGLPGKPDIVLPKHRKIILVHGCFWHVHSCRYGRVKPATNSAFWLEKRSGNAARDRRNVRALRRAGWRVLTIWECQIGDSERLRHKIAQFLSG